MEHLDTLQLVALAAALGWASGLRLYAVLFIVGAVQRLGWFDLPQGLEILAHPLVLSASGLMVVVEFFADKIPWFDSLWDTLHTFIRIPAGALLAASVIGDQGSATTLALAILGGTLAAGSHFTKAGTRALANTSPEPFSNVGLSLGEDALAATGLLLALAHPFIFLLMLTLCVALIVWLLPKLWRFVKRRFDSFRIEERPLV